MQANMINNVLLDNWDGRSFGVSVPELANMREWYVYDAYFFLRKELNVTVEAWVDAKNRGEIRHCKPYRGKWLDYVVRKQFDTFQDWLTDAGGKMEDVLYGENRIRNQEWKWIDGALQRIAKTPKYVELSVLLNHLGYVEPEKVETPDYKDVDVEQLTMQMEMLMKDRGLGLHNVWVIYDGTPVQWTEFTA